MKSLQNLNIARDKNKIKKNKTRELQNYFHSWQISKANRLDEKIKFKDFLLKKYYYIKNN